MSRKKKKRKKTNNINTSNPVNLWTTFLFFSARSHKTQRRYSLTNDDPARGDELALRAEQQSYWQNREKKDGKEEEEESLWIL